MLSLEKSKIDAVFNDLYAAKKIREQIKKKIAEAKTQRKEALAEIKKRKRARLVIEYLISKRYDKIIEMFEGVISAGLIDMFDDKYRFKFEIGRHGDNTSCDFMVNANRGEGWLDIRMNKGRSVAEIIGVLMRIVICKVDKSINKVIFLDEPFGGLEPDRQIIAGNFIKKVCERFGIQLMVVTQSSEFAQTIGSVYDLRKKSYV